MNKVLFYFMSKRVTVVLELGTIKKLRELQAKQIQKSNVSVSFSRIINEVLQKSLKN